jgi:prophage tail gpP-like protein
MSSFGGASQGGVDDGVRVQFFAKDAKFQKPRFFEDYAVRVSVLQQPAAFAVRLSARDGSAELLKAIPNNTKFQLYVGLLPQFTGYTDGQAANGANQSTSITLKGRDTLGKLFSNDVSAEKSFTNITYERLVEAAIGEVGLFSKVIIDSAKNKEVRSGVKVREVKVPVVSSEVVRTDGGAVVKHVVRAKLGESWLDFIRRHIAKRGLFVWSDFEGNIVLSSPNPNQSPLFKWVRRRDRAGVLLDQLVADKKERVNVFDAQLLNDTTNRFSEVVIYARNGGRHSGRGKLHSGFIDPEMANTPDGKTPDGKPGPPGLNVTSIAEAEFYARRKIAEANRASYHLSYTFSGHTAPALYGGRAVITPDTIAHITDEEFGIDEPMYIETVEYKSPPQTTTVTLMRLKDLVFGSDS